jgi:23S rRNA (guanosine2251-2'-O)-methyltransferase
MKEKKTDRRSGGRSRGRRSRDRGRRPEQGRYGEPDPDILIGRNPVIEALKAGRQIDKIQILQNPEGSLKMAAAMARDAGIPVHYVKRAALDRMAGGLNHQGIVANVPAYEYAEVGDILYLAKMRGEDPFIIVLDGIEDPHNLGAVIRTAECAGAHGVIIPSRRAAGITETAVKASAGAVEYVPVAKVTNIAAAIEDLKKKNIWVAACDMDGEDYTEADLSGPIALVIGNEGRGVSRIVREKCDFAVSIPLKGRIDSLNASNAAAVLMYEIRRRRDSGPG